MTQEQHIIEIITYKASNRLEEVGRYYGIYESRAAGVEAWAKKHEYEINAPTADVYPTGNHCRSEYRMVPCQTGVEEIGFRRPDLVVTVGDVRQSF